MNTFTPAPWRSTSNRGWQIWAGDSADNFICESVHSHYAKQRPMAEDRANMLLICAAPNLYEALIEAIKILPAESHAFKMALKALDLADGQ